MILAPEVQERGEDAGPRYWNELGRTLTQHGQYKEALKCYDHALTFSPGIPQIWANRGNTLRNLHCLNKAEASLREALRLKPDFANAHRNLARVLVDLGCWEEATSSLRVALQLNPELADAHADLGGVLLMLGRATEAQESYRAALRQHPENPELHMMLSATLLLAGDFKEGWKEFEWRLKQEVLVRYFRRFSAPIWNGEEIGDGTILLHAEHGLGDAIQFCRYAPQIAASARVVLEVQRPLVKLLSRLPGGIQVIARGDPLPPYNLHCPLMSLPRAVGTTLDTLPGTTPYLSADSADVALWRERLDSLNGLRVGLCWGGNLNTNWGGRRSMPLDTLASLADTAGVNFVSLQKGPQAAEAARPLQGLRLCDFTADLHDFADTAAVIECLDLVISVDTSVAHLAGALGKPVWLLNRLDSCWRWLQGRDDSPWYPSLRQFRQPAPGDWGSVIHRVRGALQRLAAGDDSDHRR